MRLTSGAYWTTLLFFIEGAGGGHLRQLSGLDLRVRRCNGFNRQR